MIDTIQCHNVVSCQTKIDPHTFYLYFKYLTKIFKMTATCKEDNNLIYQEIKCLNISQIISVTNCQTLTFD